MKLRSLFITGTDTGVGKTTVACCLAASLRRRGMRIGVLKPAETGCAADATGGRIPADAQRLAFFAASDRSLAETCPYALNDPLAPMVAADRDGVRIELQKIVAAHEALVESHDITLVEGAGGLLVPLTHSLTFADLALRLRLPLLLVVGNRLGAISHALLTVRAARAQGLEVLGYIVNALDSVSDLATETNAAVLAEWLGPALGNLPHLGTIETTDEERNRLARAGEASIHIDALLKSLSGTASLERQTPA